jgi:Lon protease-like protein
MEQIALPSADVLERLPVFPLPDVVLFPGMVLPLIVFEPRYLEMVEKALKSHRFIGVPLLEPGYEAEYEGRPNIHKVMGLGRIIGDQKLPDGRISIIVQGVGRVRVRRELAPEQSYRLVDATVLDTALEARPWDDECAMLRQLVHQLAERLPAVGPVIDQVLALSPTPHQMADLLAAYLIGDAEMRQSLLEETSEATRFIRLTQLVADMLLQVSADSRQGPAN